MATPLPTGTVTFLFTDIEGSTRLLERLGEGPFGDCLVEHDAILRDAIETHGGAVVRTTGDGFFAAFTDAGFAVQAAAVAQRNLTERTWPGDADVRVRMGLHTGRGATGVGDDYVGLDVHRAARISDAGHGGQILVSSTTAALAGPAPPAGVTLRDLGPHWLRDLSESERLFQVEGAGLASEFPRLRTKDAAPGNLPLLLTTFVGRGVEVARGLAALDNGRLVTLTGPGGTGKTRLSIHLATQVAPAFRDGAYFVALDAITDPDLVPTGVLDALDLKTASGVGPADHLAAFLADKQMLLVLDNFEQVLAAAPLVARLLGCAPELKIVVTSRAPIHVDGEQELPIPPLTTAEPGGDLDAVAAAQLEGVALFADRARAIMPNFEITDDNAASVAALTARLDGLPLAIELVAARIKVLTPAAMLERLDNRLLARNADGVPERQRTIDNAIRWSYDLLDEPVKRLFERLAVFVGGARLEEIEAICGPVEELGIEVFDGLSILVDHSLVEAVTVSGESRFKMLVVVREFAAAALAATDDDSQMRQRHARNYLDLAERAAPHLLTSHHRAWLQRLVADHDNLRAGVDWAIETADAELALRMVGSLWRFWQTQGHIIEAQERINGALALDDGPPRARALALEASGGILYWLGDWVGARPHYDQALAIMRDHGDSRAVANALYNASFPIGFSGERDVAWAYLEESKALAEASGDHLGVGRAYWGMCDQAQYLRDHDRVIEYAHRAIEEFESVDAPFDLAWSWFMLAESHAKKGEFAAADTFLARSFPFFIETRDVSAFVLLLLLKAAIDQQRGDELRAARIMGAADALRTRIGTGISEVEVNAYPELRALRENQREDVQAEIESGRLMTSDEAVALALER
jgi:predicted ATPase/class 3 adenylate cyclase